MAAVAAERSSVHGSSDGRHSSASSGVDYFSGRKSLPQQVKCAYPPLMVHFLQYCVLCTLYGDGDTEHGTDKCAYAADVLDFASPQEGELNLKKWLTFADYGNCYHCFNHFWVCYDMQPPCAAIHARCCKLVCVTLTVAWLMQQDMLVCQRALQDSGAPSVASADNFHAWLGSYVDKTAGANKWVTHATIALVNL
jgi:hypothetical protein